MLGPSKRQRAIRSNIKAHPKLKDLKKRIQDDIAFTRLLSCMLMLHLKVYHIFRLPPNWSPPGISQMTEPTEPATTTDPPAHYQEAAILAQTQAPWMKTIGWFTYREACGHPSFGSLGLSIWLGSHTPPLQDTRVLRHVTTPHFLGHRITSTWYWLAAPCYEPSPTYPGFSPLPSHTHAFVNSLPMKAMFTAWQPPSLLETLLLSLLTFHHHLTTTTILIHPNSTLIHVFTACNLFLGKNPFYAGFPQFTKKNVKDWSRMIACSANRLNLRQAPVPLPNIDELNPTVGRQRAENCSSESQEKVAIASAERSANLWLKYAPTYTLSRITLTDLMERTKNCDKDVDKANTIISGMQDLEADACSAKFMDKTGKTLACVFSHRTQMNDQATVERKGRGERTAYPGPHKWTLKDVQASKSEDQHWDGIPSRAPPDCPEDVEYIRDGVGECFKVAFPNYYSQYKAAFEAGAWMMEDPGPWLGRAIVWKFPVETHVDSLDDWSSLLSPTYSYRTPIGLD
ncbi:uncharacterized protein LACBIDRAFT_322506 [Laccaria bicolor S238N-H82]|uniref:Predicted protein n=1 Tax=Laccaria bicolor (strain S238N-H82 / ATCC MYA-4686) TaxID=486041 RepID=B0CWJ0_LACBS|nr:uncharacterized protein LACBIDRAFT_322506 [Laccaria bicolor S238N-H82]EDR13518.1 predicted protein [Laccaria bicolor S238N-H82]|eukprot:XP_001876016.1 predicted protein [Laccaria bicolor S238N-H82]